MMCYHITLQTKILDMLSHYIADENIGHVSTLHCRRKYWTC